MPDGTYVDRFRAAIQNPITLAQRVFAPKDWQELERRIPQAEPLKVGTLTGLVDYLKNVDEAGISKSDDVLVHVKDPGTVDVRSFLDTEETHYRRLTYLTASTALVGAAALPYGQFVDAETFFIALQSGFAPNAGRDDVLTLIAAIKESEVRETVDSGVAQQVTVAGGVTLVGTARIPNPVVLKPFRTFREVEQPASIFVLRAHSNDKGPKPLLALFEADGGAWKLDAIAAVAAYLREKLPDVAVIA